MGFFDDIAKSFESGWGFLEISAPFVGGALAGSGAIDDKKLGPLKYMDPFHYFVGSMFKKPEEAPPPPEAPAPPEEPAAAEQLELIREARAARRKLAATRGGTIATSPLGLPGPVAIQRKELLGE